MRHFAKMSPDERLRRTGWTITPEGCWVWRGGTAHFGYGQISFRGRTINTHRLAYEAWVGPIPEGYVVRHRCDNPPCINPDHLETGTYRDNAQDREVRGRGNPRRGEDAPNAKLTEHDVLDIRREYGYGVLTQKMLAEVYGVAHQAVHDIVRRRNWKHI